MSNNDMGVDADYRKSKALAKEVMATVGIGQVVDALISGTRMDTLEQVNKLLDSLIEAEWVNTTDQSDGAYRAYSNVRAAIDTLKSVQDIYGKDK